MKIFMFVTMFFLHIVDDYYLQGWLAQAKQEKYWLKYCGFNDDNIKFYMENKKDKKPFNWMLCPNISQKDFDLYKNDYKMALAEHTFSWSFMVHLPVMAYLLWIGNVTGIYALVFCISFITNWIIHAMVDNLKANKLKINLIQDQMIHFVQIFITWIVWAAII